MHLNVAECEQCPILSSCVPQLLELDLSRNRLQRFDSYSSLPSHLSCLKSLDLSDNEVRSVQELEHLQGMASITSVSLKGNPCEQQARDFVSYSSSVRKYFPNLEFLVSGSGEWFLDSLKWMEGSVFEENGREKKGGAGRKGRTREGGRGDGWVGWSM